MNQIATIEQSQPQQFGLVPANMTEAMQLAKMMADAKLVPAPLQKSPADCLMVIQQAIRWQMDPFAVAQECSVIQGKLMHSGKLVAAVINSRGNLGSRLAFSYEGEGDERAITVTGRLSGEAESRTVTVKVKDAKTNNRVWQTQPDQQLMYHGSRVWARRHTPELMLGVYSPEEFDEPGPRRPAPPASNVMLPPHNAETGEIIEIATQAVPPPAAQPAPSTRPSLGEGAGTHIEEDHDQAFIEGLDKLLAQAADSGTEALKLMWDKVPNTARKTLKAAMDKRHKPRAAEVDKEQLRS